MKNRLLFIVFLTSVIAYLPIFSAKQMVLFSPYDKPTTQLIDLINKARTSIHAAVYMITDKDIAQALINAHKRGVDVCIITDIISTGKYGKADLLAENGIRVYVLDVNFVPARNNHSKTKVVIAECNNDKKAKTIADDRWFSNDPIMHHKFAIIDGVSTWTGSFNWTSAANKKNHENVFVTDKREMCKAYEQQFSRIISDGSCKPYYPGRISAYMPTSLAGKVLAAVNQISGELELAHELVKIVKDHQLCTLKAS